MISIIITIPSVTVDSLHYKHVHVPVYDKTRHFLIKTTSSDFIFCR